MQYTLVIPFHSDFVKLEQTLKRLKLQSEANSISKILLCHNGKPLSEQDYKKLSSFLFNGVELLHTDEKGIGAGYKLGINFANSEYVILSASDLPFGWTDLNSFKKIGNPDFAIGSKAHSDSIVGGISLKRRIASFGFLFLRQLILGFNTPKDSQGSLIIKTHLAKGLSSKCIYNSYLFSLEIASFHLATGGKVVELPIVLENNDGESSVSVLRDGFKMFKELLELRARLRK